MSKSAMHRRDFLQTVAAVPMTAVPASAMALSFATETVTNRSLAAAQSQTPKPAGDAAVGKSRLKLGIDNFAVRGMNWKAPQLIEYAASLAVFRKPCSRGSQSVKIRK